MQETSWSQLRDYWNTVGRQLGDSWETAEPTRKTWTSSCMRSMNRNQPLSEFVNGSPWVLDANSALPTIAHPMTHLALPIKGAQTTCVWPRPQLIKCLAQFKQHALVPMQATIPKMLPKGQRKDQTKPRVDEWQTAQSFPKGVEGQELLQRDWEGHGPSEKDSSFAKKHRLELFFLMCSEMWLLVSCITCWDWYGSSKMSNVLFAWPTPCNHYHMPLRRNATREKSIVDIKCWAVTRCQCYEQLRKHKLEVVESISGSAHVGAPRN